MNNYIAEHCGPPHPPQDRGVSLVAGIMVVGVGIAARPDLPDMSTRLESRAPGAQGRPARDLDPVGPGHHPLV